MLLKSSFFYCNNKDTYPPFKNGFYLEEYFLNKFLSNKGQEICKKTYIPVLWTNFQIENWFPFKKMEMQQVLDKWIIEHPNPNGYFTIVQHDDGPLLTLPSNTIVFGACSGHIPIPLIYEDINHTLENYPKKSFHEKEILCSFVGNITANDVLPNVRSEIFNIFHDNPNFKIFHSGGWSPIVNQKLQNVFIETTVASKFAFAPRGYGRSSFRFFECFQLGTIPIYVWNDINWLPFQDKIDYSKLCIVLHVSELYNLEKTLLSIDEMKYIAMLEYYKTIKHLFELEGMTNEIISLVCEKTI
jgi:Exostosin family